MYYVTNIEINYKAFHVAGEITMVYLFWKTDTKGREHRANDRHHSICTYSIYVVVNEKYFLRSKSLTNCFQMCIKNNYKIEFHTLI